MKIVVPLHRLSVHDEYTSVAQFTKHLLQTKASFRPFQAHAKTTVAVLPSEYHPNMAVLAEVGRYPIYGGESCQASVQFLEPIGGDG